jgi:4-hydroxy-3-methylbut-2-enyl diphosphate reductase IspH
MHKHQSQIYILAIMLHNTETINALTEDLESDIEMYLLLL